MSETSTFLFVYSAAGTSGTVMMGNTSITIDGIATPTIEIIREVERLLKEQEHYSNVVVTSFQPLTPSDYETHRI